MTTSSGTSASMIIARLEPAHAADYRALMLGAYAVEPEAFTSTVAEREPLALEWWAERIESGAVFGAFVAGRLAGVAGLRPERRERTSHKATLFGVVVGAPFRGQGVGRALVDAVLDHARSSLSLRVVQLCAIASNAAALRLYEACGFVRFGLEPYAVRMGDGFAAKVHLWCDVSGDAA